MKSIFSPDKALAEVLAHWWKDLEDNKAARAELRRAKNVEDIILLPHFQRSCHRFERFFKNEQNWHIRLAMIFGLLSHVRETTEEKLPLQMAGTPKPKLSELRFRRLIQRERDDLYQPMIRVIRKLGNKASLCDLAYSMYYWGDGVKREWAFEYFPNTLEKSST